MKYREKLGYIIVGGVLMLVGMLTAGLFSPLGSQSQSDGNFGKITCMELEVVSPNGTVAVSLSSNPFIGPDMGGHVAVNSFGVTVHDEDGKSQASMHIGKHGGSVAVFCKDRKSQASMYVNEHGGLVGAFGKPGESDAGVIISSSAGGGAISVWDKGDVGVALNASKRFGGSVDVFAQNDNITIGGPIGILVQGKGEAARDKPLWGKHNGIVAIHGIRGGIFVNQPLPDRASTVYIGGHTGGGILVVDGKGMTKPGSFGSVSISATNGGRLGFSGNTDSDAEGNIGVIETTDYGTLIVGERDENGYRQLGILGR